jgi:TonB-dependent SusC/RagA subfamily outer membrane receptor
MAPSSLYIGYSIQSFRGYYARVRRYCFWIFILLSTHSELIAQKSIITGTVISNEDQLPVIGASVLEKGTQNGAITNADGVFRLEVSVPTAVLIFNYIGMEPLEVELAGRTNLNVTLSASKSLLDEVIVTGYKKEIRSEVSAAIASIKSKDIEKLVVQSVEQALQGQAPGTMVTQVTGAPGDDIAVRIRGAGTLGNNNPLYIIDGVPTTGNINMFSIGDVESIEILKDGAAAAIYGSRAANGVVLITTKRGQSGIPKFSFSSFVGVQNPIHLPELLNAKDYLTIRNEAITNANSLRDPVRQIKTYNTNILDTLPDNDWLSKVFRTAPIQHYSLTGLRWK